MKEVYDLLKELKTIGAKISVLDGKIKIEVKPGSMTSEISEKIKFYRDEILELIGETSKGFEFAEIDKIAAQESYPISDAQRRLWVASQFERVSAAYNIPINTYLDQYIDIDCFKKAIDSTIERHEILRTVFKEDEKGEVRQWILKRENLGFKIDYKDFREDLNKEDKVQLYINEDTYKAFDLVKGPLLRASLLQVEDKGYVFYVNMHHIISDGWSMGVLSRDVLSYYKAYKENKEPELKELRIQYKDYSVWQLNQLKQEFFKAHKEYWLNTLKGELPLLDLPSGKQRPKTKTYNGHSLLAYIDTETTSKLKEYPETNGGSLFMFLLGVWNVLMYRYTSQTDIIIGTPVAGREHADLEDQIGFYVNVLALRNEINPEASFDAFYQRIKDNTLKSYNHQVYPFDRLVEELNFKRDTSRSAVFDVVLALHNNGEKIKDFELKKEELNKIIDLGYSEPKLDIGITFQELGNYLSLQVVYNSDVYEKEMVEGLINHYKQLVKSVLENPKQKISQIDYLSREEKQKLLFTFNDTKADYPKDKTIIELFKEQVIRTPDNIAVVFKKKQLTYKELDKLSNQLAHYLQKNYNIKPNDMIGIMQERSEWMIVSILGILKAGAAYVPIDPDDPSARKEHILNDSSPKVLITEVNFIHDIEYYTGNIFAIDVEFDSETYSTESPETLASNSNLAYVIYTSGSTGNPKGVMIDSQAIVDYYFGILNKTNIKQCNSFGLVSTIAADLGNTVIYPSLLIGASLHIIAKEDVLDTDTLRNSNLDCLKMTPSHWKALQTEQNFFVPKKCLILGGEPFSEEILKSIKLNKAECEVYNHYGPTETTIGKLIQRIDKNQNDFKISLGKPIGNNQVYILDTALNPCPVKIIGEICISGDGLAKGYLNQEQLTEEKFITNPFKAGERIYKTGDLGRWLPDGNIEFIGRKDNQVKIRGYRIELGEIERALNSHDGVESCAVTIVENEEKDKSLIAYVVPNSDTAFTVRQILNNNKKKLETEAELYEMENGISMYSYNKTEAKILYKEIFTDRTYNQNGIVIPPNAIIIDIGANVGTFSVYSVVTFKNPQIYSFEPLPPIYDLLKKNTSLYKANVKTFNIGISDKEEEAMLDYFPHATVLSGRYSENDKIAESVKKFISNSQEEGDEKLRDEEIEELLRDRLVSQKYKCKLKSLSQVIKENEISRIDLLKIDAENAEMEILNGISEKDWQKIDQIILEVYDDNARLEKIKQILFSRGFTLTVVQSGEKHETNFYNVYSIKEKRSLSSETEYPFVSNNWYGTNALIESIRQKLSEKLPDYMSPSDIILLENIPLTLNGKLDRNILEGLINEKNGNKIDFMPPRNEIEEKLVKIWKKVLQKENISVNDSFFNLGGHSLKVLQANREYEFVLSRKLPLALFMSSPTIIEHAEYIKNVSTSQLEDQDELVRLNTFSKNNKSIIMIPPVKGEAIYYIGLSKFMEEQYNCYGIDYGIEENFLSITEIAKYYAEAINKQLPDRTTTLNIMGFSLGGAIAFEMVKILEDMNYNCELFLVDRFPNSALLSKESEKIEINSQENWIEEQVAIASKIYPKENSDTIRTQILNNLKIQKNYITVGNIKSNISCLEGDRNGTDVSMESWKKYTNGKFSFEKIRSSHDEIFNKENYAKVYDFIIKNKVYDKVKNSQVL